MAGFWFLFFKLITQMIVRPYPVSHKIGTRRHLVGSRTCFWVMLFLNRAERNRALWKQITTKNFMLVPVGYRFRVMRTPGNKIGGKKGRQRNSACILCADTI